MGRTRTFQVSKLCFIVSLVFISIVESVPLEREARETILPADARTYDIVEKDGSATGSKGVDNFNVVKDNIFGDNSNKSAGQIFAENLHAGAYTPFGLLEDAGDNFADKAFQGKTSEDKTYIEDLHAKVYQTLGSVGGGLIDAVGDNLVPKALDGAYKGLLGSVAGGLGMGFSTLVSPIAGSIEAAKVGLNGIGQGSLLGMEGKVREVDDKEAVSHDRGSWFGGLLG